MLVTQPYATAAVNGTDIANRVQLISSSQWNEMLVLSRAHATAAPADCTPL